MDWHAQRLLQEAEAATGLSDWGDEPFRDGLEMLVDTFNRESRPFGITPEGAEQDRRDVVLKLIERLRLIDWRKREPAIAVERIERPVFVVGMPRSGTTHLHRLLAIDPEARYLAAWEVMFPSPPPERATYETDRRVVEAARWMHGSGLSDDNFGAMHEFGARLPDECQHVFEFTCRSLTQSGRIQKPSFVRWLEQCDMLPAYRFHRLLLQHLQYRCPGAYWMLKSPQHLIHLDELLMVYPDARVIVTHRDPRKVMPSLVSIMTTLQGLAQTRVDVKGEYAKWLRMLPRGLAEVERLRADPRYSGQFVDVHFDDLTADPVGTVARLREHFGMDFDAAMEARVGDYMAVNPRGKKGEHRYSLEAFGLDAGEVERGFADYLGRLNGFRHGVAA